MKDKRIIRLKDKVIVVTKDYGAKRPRNPMFWIENTCSEEEWDEMLDKKWDSTTLFFIRHQAENIAQHLRTQSSIKVDTIQDLILFIKKIVDKNMKVKYEFPFLLAVADYLIDAPRLGVRDKLRHLVSGKSYERFT